jgi:hypothetical protein
VSLSFYLVNYQLVGAIEGRPGHVILPDMSDQEGDDAQVERDFDRLVKRLLTTPPQSRAEVSEATRHATEKPKRGRPKSQGKKRA